MSRHSKNDNLREIRRGSREEEIKNIMGFFFLFIVFHAEKNIILAVETLVVPYHP